MRWPTPLIPGHLVRRYKRFLADVVLDGGGEVTVHCPNPGRMLGLDAPGARVWVSRASNPRRALPFTLELVQANGGLVGINTMHPNRLVEEAIGAGRIAELRGYEVIRREVRYDERCRIDLLLRRAGHPDCFVEVKNVHLKRSAGAEFPDAVTARGASTWARWPGRWRPEHGRWWCTWSKGPIVPTFASLLTSTPLYAASFSAALAGGVEAVCYGCEVDLEGVSADGAAADRAVPQRRVKDVQSASGHRPERSTEAQVPIHDAEAFAGMRRAGRLAAEVLDMITEHVRPGVTTGELDRRCHDFILERGASAGAAELPRLSQADLHLGQPRGLPRDSR